MQYQPLGSTPSRHRMSQLDIVPQNQVPVLVPGTTTGLKNVFLSQQLLPEIMASKKGAKHPGVTLIKPDPERGIWWRVRYEDPETGKLKKVSLDPALRTTEDRVNYAKRLSKALADRRRDILLGASKEQRVPIATVVDRFYNARKGAIRSGTVATYKHATDRFLQWADSANIRTGDDLRNHHLEALKTWLFKQCLTSARQGGSRGTRRRVEKQRSAHTVNRELRTLRTVLRKCRALGLVAHITGDGIDDGLKSELAPRNLPTFFRTADLRLLMEAAIRHDASKFELTRAEHDGLMPPGSTWRHEEIAPYLATILLTGMRRGEGLQLQWEHVDATTTDADGLPKGDIMLPASVTKTKHGRQIDLGVTPLLLALLETIRPKSRKGPVFPHLTQDKAVSAIRRLRLDYDAPAEFNWQALRRTCSTFQVNAHSLFGTSSAHASGRRLGHSPTVADKHYSGLLSVSRTAQTLEAAMGVEKAMGQIIQLARNRRAKPQDE